MIQNLWNKWKEIRDTDPVKARLLRVLLIAGVLVMPFLSVWVFAGFAKAMSMVLFLVVCGLALLVGAAIANFALGWAAHYVFTGRLADFDDWFDSTILDEWESYQNSQRKAARAATDHVASQVSQPKHKPTPPQDDGGPSWLKN